MKLTKLFSPSSYFDPPSIPSEPQKGWSAIKVNPDWSVDDQIADKIIQAVQDESGWDWIEHDFGSNGWIKKERLKIKAFEHMSPSNPWNYIHFQINGEEWEIPSDLREKMWRACYPLFEKVRASAKENAKNKILNSL